MYVDILDPKNHNNQYDLMLLDPPWDFKTYSKAGEGRNANQNYPTQGLEWIKSLPVRKLLNPKRGAVVMWTTDTHLEQAFEVFKAWDIKYKTVALYFAKLNKSAKKEALNVNKDFFMGMGYYGRANPEPALLGLTEESEVDISLLGTSAKAPTRVDAGVRKLMVDYRREHSRKPDETHTRLERLFGEVPRIELFARESRTGWDCWGNEVEKFNESNISN